MPFPDQIVPLVEIGPRTETGYSSGAHRCLGRDGRYYYVKSPHLAGAAAVVAEWIAAGLATAMGLPVREASLVTIPKALISSDLIALGHGPAFGSLELPQADPLSWSSAEKLPAALRAEVLLFDYWIRNMDRTLGAAGGNPNLLAAAGTPLALIDHGNAFDPDFNAPEFLGNHVFAGSRGHWLEKTSRTAWQKRARQTLKLLPGLWEQLPPEWHENQFGDPLHQFTLETLHSLLHRFTPGQTAFWPGLLSP